MERAGAADLQADRGLMQVVGQLPAEAAIQPQPSFCGLEVAPGCFPTSLAGILEQNAMIGADDGASQTPGGACVGLWSSCHVAADAFRAPGRIHPVPARRGPVIDGGPHGPEPCGVDPGRCCQQANQLRIGAVIQPLNATHVELFARRTGAGTSHGTVARLGVVTLSGLIRLEVRVVLAGVRYETGPAYATHHAARHRIMLRPPILRQSLRRVISVAIDAPPQPACASYRPSSSRTAAGRSGSANDWPTWAASRQAD